MGQRHTTSQVHLFDVAATAGSIPMFHWVQFARNIKAYLLGKNKKDITSLSSAEVAQRVVKVFTRVIQKVYFIYKTNSVCRLNISAPDTCISAN